MRMVRRRRPALFAVPTFLALAAVLGSGCKPKAEEVKEDASTDGAEAKPAEEAKPADETQAGVAP